MALNLSLTFKATADELFSAWTEPEFVSQWLFKGDGEAVDTNIDLTVGGRFSILERTKNGAVDHSGTYVAIDKPHFLAFTLEASKDFGGMSHVQIDFKQKAEECEMVFQQTGVEPEIASAKWRRMFLNLTMTLIKG